MTSSASIAEVGRFETYYYSQKDVPMDMPLDWLTFKKKILNEMTGKEKERLSLIVCRLLGNPNKDSQCLVLCITICNTINTGYKGGFDGSDLKPDISSVVSTCKQAERVVRHGKLSRPVYWDQLVSQGEVKCEPADDGDGQIMPYAKVLPRARPDLAGMLYIFWESLCFRLHWSDTSGIISSQQYRLSDEASWSVLPCYVLALLMGRLLSPRWVIHMEQGAIRAKVLFASSAHGRQTCVFHDEAAQRIIKDQWRDMRRRFKESAILEKIKGVSGVVQVDFLETATMDSDNTEVLLGTIDMHSGTDTVIKTVNGDRIAPRREKRRSVLKSVGKPLTGRTSVRQLSKALYDSIQGDGLRLLKIWTLHRDTKLNDYPDVKFINQTLDPSKKEVKESVVLIDWDNASNSDEVSEASPLTNRAGTPIFVACAVISGKLTRTLDRRSKFPELSGEAKELYLKAYSSEKYEFYRNAINNTPAIQSVPIDADIAVEHCGDHDVEFVYWVLVHQLLHAWPVNEGSQVSELAGELMNVFKAHTFKKDIRDSRFTIYDFVTEKSWCDILHPRLAILCKMMVLLTQYISTEWALWNECDLPKDHCHEAMSRLLLDGIVLLKDDPIAL